VDADFLEQALSTMSTFSVNAAGTIFPVVGKLCLQVMEAFGLPANANIYATYKGAKVSVPPHNDPQDLLILQMQGEKWWTLYEPQVKFPMTSQCKGRADDHTDIPSQELQEPLGTYHLRPGDVLYVPFGMVHRTSTATEKRSLCTGKDRTSVLAPGCTSLHLAMGIHMESYGHVYGKLLECVLFAGQKLDTDTKVNAIEVISEALEKEVTLREPLPLGFPRRMRQHVWKHIQTQVLQSFTKHLPPTLSIDAVKEQVKDGADRAEAAIGVLHAALLRDFRAAYVEAEGTEGDGASGYEWLDARMGAYQKAMMKKCSPELEPGFEF